MTQINGKVLAVTTTRASAELTTAAPSGATVLQVQDTSDLDESGGTLTVETSTGQQVTLVYVTADPDDRTVTLTAPTTVALADGDVLIVSPEAVETIAFVELSESDPPVEALVPLDKRMQLEDGIREEGLEETVLMETRGSGFEVVDVTGARPSVPASFVRDAEELLLADQKTLGEKLTEAAVDLEAARGRLTAAEQRLNDAFSEIDLLPDTAYVAAAKQQAIDAAAITAQQKADAAKATAIADAQGKLATARTQLETAIASGDAATISSAEQKVLAARAEAIAAAAADATAKADQAKAAAIAAAAIDATAKATEAITRANEALTAAESAQATADNAIRTYYGPTRPWEDGTSQPDDALGDMWYDDATGQAYRWNGTAWTVIVDQTIGQALAAAQSAQTTADGKITAFYQPNEPLEGEEGDLWFDTDDSNKVYRRTSSAWVSVADARIDAQATALAGIQSDLTGLEGTLDGKSNIWVQSAQPTGMTAADKGDIWINDGATPRTTKVWNGTAWVDADSRITKAVADVATKITTYYTANTTAPTGTFVNGDLWIDVNGKIARRSGSSWVTVSDPKALADAALVAASQYADQQILLQTNLIDNPSRTGEVGRWGVNGSAAQIVDRTLEGASIKVLELTSTANLWAYSSGFSEAFKIDPTKAYMVSLWAEDEKALDAPGASGSGQFYIGFTANKATGGLTSSTTVGAATGVATAPGNNVYFIAATAAAAPIGGFRRYVGYLMPIGTDPAKMKSLGVGVTANAILPSDAAFGRVWVINQNNHNTPGGRKVWVAHSTVIEVDPLAVTARQEAIEAAASDATEKADQAETNAKAFATTRTDGLAKTLWSTALPGTTTAPQNSVWYRTDASGKIIAVFTQTAAGTAASWSARPITSEAIDNLDVGKLTAASGVVNQLVANAFAAKLADIIQANIGNLTVTGDAHLNEVVAQRIWGDVASFAQVTADQVLAGNIQAVWTITSDGLIIAGNPLGRAVEMDDESITIYDVDADGVRYRSSGLGGTGADSLTLTDADGTVTAGFTEDGTMVAQSAEVAGDMTLGGTSVMGTRADPPAEDGAPGHLDKTSWGVLQRQRFPLTAPSTGGRTTGQEWGYSALKATLIANRQYRASASVEARPNVTGGYVMCRLRAQDGSANQNSLQIARVDMPAAVASSNTPQGYLEGLISRTTDTEVEIFLTYQGVGGATPQMMSAEMMIEDIGYAPGTYGGGSYKQIGPPSTGTEEPPPSTTKRDYTSTWRASDSATFWADGSRRSASDSAKDIIQGSYGSSTSSQRGVALFAGGAVAGEVGKTIGQALAGATVKSVYIYLTANHTGSSTGARYIMGPLGSSSIPSTLGSGVVGTVTKPSGSYVKPGSPKKFQFGNTFFDGSNRGVVIGDRSTSDITRYVRVNGHDKGSLDTRPKVVIEYTR